jgi:hypothetical protein
VRGRGKICRQLASGEVAKVTGELANYQQFAWLSEQIVEVNQAISEARPTRADQQRSVQSTEELESASTDQRAPEKNRCARSCGQIRESPAPASMPQTVRRPVWGRNPSANAQNVAYVGAVTVE